MREFNKNIKAQFYLLETVTVIVILLAALVLIYNIDPPGSESLSTSTQLKKLADDTLFYLTSRSPSEDYISATDDCIGRWSFEDINDPLKALDSSINGNDGDITGADYSENNVNGDYAIQFDGVGDYINCHDVGDFKINQDFTISGWINCNDTDMDNNEFGNFLVSKSVFGFGILSGNGSVDSDTLPNNKVSIVFEDNNSEIRYLAGDAELTFDTWYHIAATYNYTKNEIIFYLNGNFEKKYKLNTLDEKVRPVDHVGSNLRFGVKNFGTDKYLKGFADEIIIWNRTLTSGEIKSTYNLNLLSNYESILSQWIFISDNASYDKFVSNMSTLLPNHVFYQVKIYDGLITRTWYSGENRELANSVAKSHHIISHDTRIYDIELELWSIL